MQNAMVWLDNIMRDCYKAMSNLLASEKKTKSEETIFEALARRQNLDSHTYRHSAIADKSYVYSVLK